MPTNYALPNQGQYTFTDYIGINSADPQQARRHLFPSILQNGGFQEMPELIDMYEIPVEVSGAGFGTPKITMDGFGSGRRRLGMLVHVLAEQKIYKLIPQGFYGNGGNSGLTEWNALTDTQKYEALSPTATYNASYTPPNNYTESTPTGNAEDCWVELSFGQDGNPVSAMSFDNNSGQLTITLTHDGTGGGTPIEFSVVIPVASNTYNSNLAGTIAMVEDVGGMEAGTLVSDINGQTYDQLFDTILFPTSYPTASQPSVSLTDTFSLKEIGEVVNVPLTTTANLGQITLNGSNQGPFAGAVDSALIEGPGGPYALNVGPGATDIDNLTVSSHTVVEGTVGNQWMLTAQFSDGPMPLDSTGADYPSLQWTTGSKTNSTNFEGVYPIFLGNASNGFDQRALISHGANNIQCNQQYDEDLATGLYHRISIPNDMIDGRTIQVFQLNTVSGNYDEATSGWVQTADADRTIQGNQVAYTLLTSSVAITGGNDYRIKFI